MLRAYGRRYTEILNRYPLGITVGSGAVAYAMVFAGILLAALNVQIVLLYSLICLSASLIAIGFHWAMFRYQNTSLLAQFTHLIITSIFLYFALALSVRTALQMD